MAFQARQEKSSETIEGLRSGAVGLNEVVVYRADGSVPRAGVSESPEVVEGARGTQRMARFDENSEPAPAEMREEAPGMARGRRGTTIMAEFEEGAKAAPRNEDYVIEGETGPAERKKKKEDEWSPY